MKDSIDLHVCALERKVIMVGMNGDITGVKAPKEAILVKRNLKKLPYIETKREIWEAGGEISASLRSTATTIPLSDLIIAGVALSGDHVIFTIGPHFEKVDGLRLHTWMSDSNIRNMRADARVRLDLPGPRQLQSRDHF